MNHQLLFQSESPVRVGLIGTGDFGRSFLFQASRIDQLDVVAVCDRSIDVARQACRHCGVAPADIVNCADATTARAAIEAGKIAVTDEGMMLADLPLDVIVEATGAPEVGARHGLAAIKAGKHLVMVSKETASVVGPILAHKARQAGVVYTTGDGDQPSMCIGLITWAQSIGLEIVCVGKAAESDTVYDVAAGTISNGRQVVDVAEAGKIWSLWPTPQGDIAGVVAERGRMLTSMARASVADYAEMAIVSNNTGIGYDRSTLHAPTARMQEMPDLLRHVDDGGILTKTPAIDIVNCLRRDDEVGFAGGVFVVVKCYDPETWDLLRRKGHLLSRDGSHAMIYLPYHLLGVETATSVLAAAVLGLPTGGGEVRPVAEVGMRAVEAQQAGRRLTMDHAHAIAGVRPQFSPPQPNAPENVIPYYMAAGNVMLKNVEAGQAITYEMVQEPAASVLWTLKRAQDRLFL